MKKLFGIVSMILLCATFAQSASKPFKVLCYSGYRDGQAPGGQEPSEAQVREDLQMLLPYTFAIRIYSLSGHSALVPKICDELGMELHVGVWIDNDEAANQTAMTQAIKVINEGHPCIKSVIVGNEYLLRQETVYNTAVTVAEPKLIGYIDYVKARIPAGLPIGTAEPYWWWIKTSRNLWEKVDIIYWQVHPWWDNQAIANSVTFISGLHTQVRAKITSFKLTNPNKRDVISETGWPTGATHGGAVGSIANQQTFIQKLHAWAYPANMEYWYFCPFDEKWKDETGGVGSQWGIWNSDRTPKASATNLNTLIPATMRYTSSGWGTVGTINRSSSVAIPNVNVSNCDEVRVFNILGREVNRILPERNGLTSATKTRNGAGIFVYKYMKDGKLLAAKKIISR